MYINKRTPYEEQESEELGDDVIARFNPDTGDVENVEVLIVTAYEPDPEEWEKDWKTRRRGS